MVSLCWFGATWVDSPGAKRHAWVSGSPSIYDMARKDFSMSGDVSITWVDSSSTLEHVGRSAVLVL